MRKWLFVLGMTAVMPMAAVAADADAGKTVFNKCKACHQTGAGAKNVVGPHLDGVVGRKAGSLSDFAYSEAMKNSGLTWDEATLKEFLTNPRQKVKGTKMVFAGIKNADELDNLVAYLKGQ
jgi:cytochrome c